MAVRILESKCAMWKTTLPRVDRNCESPLFNLDGVDVSFVLFGKWDESMRCETWDVGLRTTTHRENIGVITYLENEQGLTLLFFGELKFQHCKVNSCSADIFELSRKQIGFQTDNISLVFQLHFDWCNRNNFKDAIFPAKLKRLEEHPSCLRTLSGDIEKLFDDDEHSDVVLHCGDRSFFANKGILSARSDVFGAMFKNEMSENKTGTVDVVDMEPCVLEQFLRYVYSGRLEAPCMDLVFDLYRAGDKYDMPSLKRKCAMFMVNNLSEECVCEVLALAETFADAELLKNAMRFAVDRDGFIRSDAWINFTKEHPKLAVEVYKKFHAKYPAAHRY